MTIVMLIAAWLAVALAMLWGVMRISRRHHPRAQPTATENAQFGTSGPRPRIS